MLRASFMAVCGEPGIGQWRLLPVPGCAVWLLLIFLQPPLAVWILAFGPTVIVPLGLEMIRRHSTLRRTTCLWRFTPWLLLPAVTLFVGSFWFEQSVLAGVMAAPWLATTLLLAASGIVIAWRNGLRIDSATGFAAALFFLPVGAGWALISRLGLQPQGFSHEIVLLTGVHFHYAGFALPILAGLAIGSVQPTVWQRVLLGAIVIGVPLVGVGISLSPTVEVGAAILLATASFVLAGYQVREALHSNEANRSMLLLISSTSLAAAMVLAGVYAVGEFTEMRWLSIPVMIQSHGVLNAFGFVLCGFMARWIGQTTGREDVA